MKSVFKKAIPHLIALLVMVGISLIYFYPQLQDKKMPQGDYLTFEGMAQETMAYEEEFGRRPLWTNSMFGGMPTYQINAKQSKNLMVKAGSILRMGFDKPIGLFIMGMICFYILMLSLKVNSWIALLASFCFAFTTNNLVLYEAGHVTKVAVIMTSPAIIAGILLVFRKKYLVGGLVYSIAFAFNMMYNHFQMTYYLGIVMGILCLLMGIEAIRKKELKHLGISFGIFVLGILLGAGCSASKLLTTYEYGQDTMRGQAILEKTQDALSSAATDGLSFEYAMNWSNGAEDLLASFVPLVVGGSTSELMPSSSKLIKDLRRNGAQVNKDTPMPLYWGSLPSTSGPIYFGAIVFFLFILGLINVKGQFKWWIASATLLTFMFSMGSNLEWFNRLFFDYLPFFSKFRTPNSVLSVTAILIPLMGFYGLHKFISEKEKETRKRQLFISSGIMIGMCAFLALLGPSLFDLTGGSDARFQGSLNMDLLMEDRASVMRSSSFRSLMLILLSAGGMFLFHTGKLKSVYLIGILAVLNLYDLIGTDQRYVSANDFVKERQYKRYFEQRPVDKKILADKNPHYRVHDLTINYWNSSSSSYYHKTIGGMHAAKLQRIQDLHDYYISKGNQNVLNMLNTRYFIVPDNNNQPTAQLNPAALGNAWFVNELKVVQTANEEIESLGNIDPQGEAIVHQEYQDYIQGLQLNKTGRITLNSYSPDVLEYSSSSDSEQFAVFSEMWYGPNKGWQAYVDGEKVDHIRVNYGLRGMKIPAGSHQIKFEFKPSTYYTGETISLISSFALLLLLLYVVYAYFRTDLKTIKQ